MQTPPLQFSFASACSNTLSTEARGNMVVGLGLAAGSPGISRRVAERDKSPSYSWHQDRRPAKPGSAT